MEGKNTAQNSVRTTLECAFTFNFDSNTVRVQYNIHSLHFKAILD